MDRLTQPGQDFEGQFCRECGCTLYGEPNGCNHPNGSCPSYCYFTTVAERLAAYEEIGMEPEEIIQFMALFHYMMCRWQEMRDQALLEHLKEILPKEDEKKIIRVGSMGQPLLFPWEEDKAMENAGYVAEARYDTILF